MSGHNETDMLQNLCYTTRSPSSHHMKAKDKLLAVRESGCTQ